MALPDCTLHSIPYISIIKIDQLYVHSNNHNKDNSNFLPSCTTIIFRVTGNRLRPAPHKLIDNHIVATRFNRPNSIGGKARYQTEVFA